MNITAAYKEALAKLKEKEGEPTADEEQQFTTRYFRSKVVESFVKTKHLNEEHRVKGGLKDDLTKAYEEYEGWLNLIHKRFGSDNPSYNAQE